MGCNNHKWLDQPAQPKSDHGSDLGFVALVVHITRETAVFDDSMPIDTHRWTYTQCTRTSKAVVEFAPMCSKTMMSAPPSLSEHAQQERTKRSTSTIKKTSGSSSPLANQSRLHFITPTELQPNPQVFAPPSLSNQTCLFISSVAQTHKQPNTLAFNWRKPPKRTPVQVNSTVSLKVMIRERCGRHIVCPRTLLSRTESGEVRQPHHVSAHSPFPETFESVQQPHHVARTVVEKKSDHSKATKCQWR